MRLLTLVVLVAVLLGCPGGGSMDGGSGGGSGGGGEVDAGLLPRDWVGVGFAVMVQNSKVVVAGAGGPDSVTTRPDLFVARANADGTLDATFATRGYTSYDLDGGTGMTPNLDDGARAVMADADKVVVAGYARGISTVPSGAAMIARFNADGTLDTTFNTRGYALIDFNPMSNVDNTAAAFGLAKRTDGKYMLAGGVNNGPTRGDDYFAFRLNTDGSLDNTFSTGTPIDFGANETATDIVLQGNNTVLGGGSSFRICRLTDTGMTDMTFGTMGSVSSAGGTMHKLLARGDGRLLAVGLRSVDVGTATERSVLKLFQVSANGIADGTFGTTGVAEIDGMMGNGPSGDLRGATLLADGSLLLLSDNITGSRVFKIKTDGTLDTAWGMNGMKPSGLRISILNLLFSPRGSHALTVDGSTLWVTGTTLIELSGGTPVPRFAISKVAL